MALTILAGLTHNPYLAYALEQAVLKALRALFLLYVVRRRQFFGPHYPKVDRTHYVHTPKKGEAMNTFPSHKGTQSLWIAITLLSVLTGSLTTRAQSVTWQDLPFPQDSSWPGSQGSPATTNGNDVVLHGQPVRSTQTFNWGSTFSFKTLLDVRPGSSTDDGSFQFNLIPVGEAPNVGLTSYTGLFMQW